MNVSQRQKYYMEQIELIQSAQEAGLESNFLGYAQINKDLYEAVQDAIPYAQKDRDEAIQAFIDSVGAGLSDELNEAIANELKQASSSAFEEELVGYFDGIGITLSQSDIQYALQANELADAVRTQLRFTASYDQQQ